MATLKSTDPGNDELVGEVPVATASQVRQAIDSARAAQPEWAARPLSERTDILRSFEALLLERRDEACRLVSRESGKPLAEARMADVFTTLQTARHLAKHAAPLLGAKRFRLRNPLLADRTSTVSREPLGVVGVIAPWNYPLSIPAAGLLPSLVVGNTVVFKPSEHTPIIGQWLTDALHDAGVPEDVLHIVHGAGTVGKAVAQSDVDGLLFTGSVATGQAVAREHVDRFTPLVLELGGKDPMVVLDGARFDLTVDGALWGAFTNAGQTCAAVERLYVPRAEEQAYLDALVAGAGKLRLGHGLEEGVQMGPLINEAAVKRVMEQVRDAEKSGATILAGGHVRDDLGPRFVEPTVISGVDHTMSVMRDETFGPLLPVMPHDGPDDAVRLANDTTFGLSASVWGPRNAVGPVAARIKAGSVTCNDCLYTYAAPEAPWGGWNQSGIGASHGELGLEAVTRWKHTNRAPARRRRSPWYYPYDESLEKLMDDGMTFLHGGSKGLGRAGGVVKAWSRRR